MRGRAQACDGDTIALVVSTGDGGPRIGVVTEPMANRPLIEVMDWLITAEPSITQLEIGTGGYAPTSHCDMPLLLKDAGARKAWLSEISSRGLTIGALNAWGNPLHPDEAVAKKHDSDLRDSIRLAAQLGVDRVVALDVGEQLDEHVASDWVALHGVRQDRLSAPQRPHRVIPPSPHPDQRPGVLLPVSGVNRDVPLYILRVQVRGDGEGVLRVAGLPRRSHPPHPDHRRAERQPVGVTFPNALRQIGGVRQRCVRLSGAAVSTYRNFSGVIKTIRPPGLRLLNARSKNRRYKSKRPRAVSYVAR